MIAAPGTGYLWFYLHTNTLTNSNNDEDEAINIIFSKPQMVFKLVDLEETYCITLEVYTRTG